MKELAYQLRRWTRAPRKATKPVVYGCLGRGLAWVYHAWLLLVWKTGRVRETGFVGFDAALASGRGPVVAMYHENVLFAPFAFRRYRPLTVVSRADWGSLITHSLNHFGFRVIRGGSTGTHARAGSVVKALEEVVREEPGRPMGLAVDGSRGPAYRVKPGAVALACRTGAPLFTMHLANRPALRLPTWDKTKVPLPFGRIVIRIDGPVAPDATTPEQQAALLAHVDRQLAATAEAAEGALRPASETGRETSFADNGHPA